MLNENLNLEQCIELLNKMAKGMEDFDADSEGVIYIIVNQNKINCLKELIPNEYELANYLNNFGEDWEDQGFDITGVWTEICGKFDVDIWFNGKEKEFYVKE